MPKTFNFDQLAFNGRMARDLNAEPPDVSPRQSYTREISLQDIQEMKTERHSASETVVEGGGVNCQVRQKQFFLMEKRWIGRHQLELLHQDDAGDRFHSSSTELATQDTLEALELVNEDSQVHRQSPPISPPTRHG
ncbi:hypothetical protein R3P38DRAFT_2781534 [Favolaschia claudopus]|uniref:Neurotrophin-3 n=1 Tax=Favolaschia claudopus TaxID=2862362 RepID=A0AAW0B4B5_9AGAR